MLDDQLFERGVTRAGEILGAADAERLRARHAAAVASGDPDRNDFSTAIVFGFMLDRPQLPLRERAIIMLACDIAQGTPLAMDGHLRVALHAGLTRDEIDEIVFQTTPYCGIPRAKEADAVVNAFFANRAGATPPPKER